MYNLNRDYSVEKTNDVSYTAIAKTRKKLQDFFQTKQRSEEQLGYISEEYTESLQNSVVITPATFDYIMMIISSAIIMLVVYGWNTRSKFEIESKVQSLVYSLGVEVETSIGIFFNLPIAVTQIFTVLRSLSTMPGGYLYDTNNMQRSDAALASVMTEYGSRQPYMSYLGEEDGGFQGTKLSPSYPFGLHAVFIDNSSSYDTCSHTPLRKEYKYKKIGPNYVVRNMSAYIKQRVGYDPRKRGWYKAATAVKYQPAWSSLYTFFSGPLGISAAQAYNVSGIYGVAAVDYTLEAINEKLQGSMGALKARLEGLKGTAYVVEKSGDLVGLSTPGLKVTRQYFPGASPQRVRADDICERKEKFQMNAMTLLLYLTKSWNLE